MLIYSIRKPLVSTSANISGEPAPQNFDGISEDIKNNVEYVVNLRQHETKKSMPSRIMKIGMDGLIEIIR
jgi:L-threonylcarbamoyladenylate synthase